MLPTLGSYTAGNSVCNATNVQAIKSKRILGFQALDYDIVDNYVGDLLGAKTQQVINVRCTGSRNLPEQYLVWLGDESMTLSTVYISALKQTTIIRIENQFKLCLT